MQHGVAREVGGDLQAELLGGCDKGNVLPGQGVKPQPMQQPCRLRWPRPNSARATSACTTIVPFEMSDLHHAQNAPDLRVEAHAWP